MKLNKKQENILKSYLRSYVIAVSAAYSAPGSEFGVEGLLLAGLIAVAGPAIRAIDKKDPTFGLVATVVDTELKKLEKKVAAKKVPAKKKKSSGGGTPDNHL
jgi:hypothetical protein